MKLISKTILYYLLISLPLLIISGYISYYLIRGEVREGTDNSLWKEKINAEKLVKSFVTPHNVTLSSDGMSKITISKATASNYFFSDTLIYDREEDENVNHRILNTYFKVNETTYLITLAKPTFEEDALIAGLVSSLLMVIGFLMCSFFVVNWLLSKWLWKPFYKTIHDLNQYDLKNNTGTDFSSSKIKEFNQLNEALNKMTNKIYTDFIHQKEFTENAAHEMQTPLAVMKAKLELLIQSPNLKEEEMNQLQAIDTSVSKLASLNKALLLLAKIENNQFKDSTEISLQKVIEKVIENYEDIIESKNISIEKKFTVDFKIKMNPILCDVLVSNLIQNATRHTITGGAIKIELTANTLLISNSGNPLNIKAEELFDRFKKNDSSKESLGLGLSIVKSITDLYNVKISYSFSKNLHSFSLIFFSQN